MDGNLMEMNEQQRQLRNEFDELSTHEFREDVRLSENEQRRMDNAKKAYHTVESSKAENLRIADMLAHADEIHLEEYQKTDLKLRIRQNKNFELINSERDGGDSTAMKNVKDSIRDIDKLLRDKAGNAYQRKTKLSEAMRMVDTAIGHCNTYLGRGKPFFWWRRQRYYMVEETKVRLQEDLAKISLALESDEVFNELTEENDKLFDLINSEKIGRRAAGIPVGEKSAVRSMMRSQLRGVGSMDYARRNFEDKIKNGLGDGELTDRTTAIVTYCVAYSKKQNKPEHAEKNLEFYKALTISTDDSKQSLAEREAGIVIPIEQKQKKVEALEEFFDVLMAYDVKNFDVKSYEDIYRDKNFRQNMLIVKAGWDSDKFISEYKNLLADPKGLKLKYSADDFAELEAKRNMMGILGAYYEVIENYYDFAELWTEELSDLMALNTEQITERMIEAQSAKKPNVAKFYLSLLTLRNQPDGAAIPALSQHDVTKSADILLQGERQLHVNKYILLSEKFKDDDKLSDGERAELKKTLLTEIRGDRDFGDINPDILPYEYIKSVVVMLSDKKPAEGEYVKVVTDYIRELVSNEDIESLTEQLKSMKEDQKEDKRDLLIYALCYGSKAFKLSRESFDKLDTENMEKIFDDKIAIMDLSMDENTSEEEKQRITELCSKVLIERFNVSADTVKLLRPDTLLDRTKKALNAVPDMEAIPDIIGGRYEILALSCKGMDEMDEKALSKLRGDMLSVIKGKNEFKDYNLDILPVDVLAEVIKHFAENAPSPENLEEELKKVAGKFAADMDIEKRAAHIEKLSAKKEKSDKDALDIREYCIYYLMNDNMHSSAFDTFKSIDTDGLLTMVRDMEAVKKLSADGIKDVSAYRDAKKLCIKVLTEYIKVPLSEVDLIPIEELISLSKQALGSSADAGEVSAMAEVCRKSVIRKNADAKENDEFAGDSLYKLIDTIGPEADELTKEMMRGQLIAELSAESELKGTLADTAHMDMEMLLQAAIAKTIGADYAGQKLDAKLDKETMAEYSMYLFEAIAKALGLKELKPEDAVYVGYEKLLSMADRLSGAAFDKKAYDGLKEEFQNALKQGKDEAEAKAKVPGLSEEQKAEADKFFVKREADLKWDNEEAKSVYLDRGKQFTKKKELRKEWTKDEKETLSLLGELTFTTEITDEKGLAVKKDQRVQGVLLNNAATLAKLLNSPDVVKSLLGGMPDPERALTEGISNELITIMEEMKKVSPDAKWDAASVKKCLMTEDMVFMLKDMDASIEKAMLKGSKQIESMIEYLSESALEGTEDTIGADIFSDYKPPRATVGRKFDMLKSESYSKTSANGKFLQKALKDYYKYSTAEEKRFMMSYLIKELQPNQGGSALNDTRKVGHYYASLVKGAGPVMQKLIQGIPEKMVSTGMQEAVSVVKSSLRPIPEKYVDGVLERIKNNSPNIFAIKKLRSLGAASIAETFLCEIETKKGQKQEVVVKILRPDAKMHIDNEADFLVKLAHDADETGVMEKSITNHINKIREELDFSTEVKNAMMGAKAYNSTDKKTGGKVTSVAINTDVPVGSDYIIMNKAEGVTLDKYIADLKDRRKEIEDMLKSVNPWTGKKDVRVNADVLPKLTQIKKELIEELKVAEKKKAHVYKLSQKWTQEALFGSLFHHGDLHSGNIMISDKCATVLDYGNATKFNDKDLVPITKMMAAAGYKNAKCFVEPLLELLANEGIKVTPLQRSILLKRTANIMEIGNERHTGKRIMATLMAAQESGIPIPRAIHNFAMCEQRLENSVDELNEAIADLQSIEKQLSQLDVTEDISTELNPFVSYMNKIYRNRTSKKPVPDEEIADKVMDEFGLVSDADIRAKLIADDKANTFGKSLCKGSEDIIKSYTNPKNKADFDYIEKNRGKILAELKKVIAYRNSPDADNDKFQDMKNNLQDMSYALMSNGPSDVLIGMGFKAPYDMFVKAFVDLDYDAAVEYFDNIQTGIKQAFDLTKKFKEYTDAKANFFTRSATKEKTREAFLSAYMTGYRNSKDMEGPVAKLVKDFDKKENQKVFDIFTKTGTPESKAFKAAYEAYKKTKAPNDLVRFKSTFGAAIKAELMRFKAMDKERPEMDYEGLAEIISDEVMSHEVILWYRLDKKFIKELTPEGDKIIKEIEDKKKNQKK